MLCCQSSSQASEASTPVLYCWGSSGPEDICIRDVWLLKQVSVLIPSIPESEIVSHSVMSRSLWSHGLSMEFSRQEKWSGLPFPSPGIFPTQGSNPGLLHCRQILYHLSYQGKPHAAKPLIHNWLLRPLELWRTTCKNIFIIYLDELLNHRMWS